MRLATLLGPELKELLKEDPDQVRELLDEIHPEDLADLIGELDADEAAELLARLPAADAAPILPAVVIDIVPAMGPKVDPGAVSKLLEDAVAQELRVLVDPNSVGGKQFLEAKPFHIAHAYRLEIPLLLRAGRQEDAAAVSRKYSSIRDALDAHREAGGAQVSHG